MTTTVIDGDGRSGDTRRTPRIPLIDQARGIALIAMAVYHFTWDLSFFGYIAPETATTGGWRLFARVIASSFLFLAGFSLALGHANGFRARPFLIRFGKIAAAAAVITIATWFAFPETFIFFGILHAIAAVSLVGLLFLRVPVIITLMVAGAAVAAPLYLRSPLFDHPALWWVGLSVNIPRSNDYVPLLPWLAPALVGVAFGRLFVGSTLPARLAGVGGATTAWWKTVLSQAGRHSLAIYLLHQPLLFALVAGVALVMPPDRSEQYLSLYVRTCTMERPAGYCQTFCGCALDRLKSENILSDLMTGKLDTATDTRANTIASQCTAKAETETNLKE